MPLSREGPAADVVLERMLNQVAKVRQREPGVRRDEPGSVHRMRVTLRRLRSLLATFGPMLDPRVAREIRAELKWLAGILGEARDAEVMEKRLEAALDEEPTELVLGDVRARIHTELGGECRRALTRSVEAMDSERYTRLLDALDALTSEPPWTDVARQPVDDVLPDRLRSDWRRLRRRVLAAERAHGRDREQRLHDVRKAAKRLRYAAETLIPLYGGDAERLARASGRIQSVLGDRHDAVVTRERLRQLAVQVHLDGGNAFTYGRLHALEQSHIADTEAEFAQAWRKVSRKRLRRWLH